MRSPLGWFRRSQSKLQTTKTWHDEPEATEVPLLAGGNNPIDALIDQWRLPRKDTRAEVTARVGISLDPIYRWDALVLKEALSLPGAMQPWTASAFERLPPQFPITHFSSLVSHGDHAHQNIERTAEFLGASLGPATVGKRWNTLVARWRSGIAEISLTVWPPEWQSGMPSNSAEDRNPRLRTACRVYATSSFRLRLSEREKAWVAGLEPLIFDGEVGSARNAIPGTEAPNETQLEYVRDPENWADGRHCTLGVPSDDKALIVVSNQLFVIPADAIIRLEVIRMTPAKGGGGSTLAALCRTAAPAVDGQSIFLAQHADPDGLTAFAQHLGRRLGAPVEISPYYPDC